MKAEAFFHQHHDRIVASWFDALYGDRSMRYHKEPADELKHRMNTAALAFRQALLFDDWTDLQAFITMIAQQRFNQGFKVSEVQKAFELYRETLIPLLFSEIDAEAQEPLLMKLQSCMVYAITQFSEYFQRIHERVELENRNREMEKLKALSLQAASIAHDVRNPLSTVRMNLQLFARTELSPESHRLIEASLSEVNQIEKSLQEMMSIRFPLRLSFSWVDIRKLLDVCLTSLHQRLTQNQVAILLRISRRIDQIKADPHRLEQALLNLLFNAVEAQPSGGKLTLIVRPLERESKPFIEILVADQGPGVPKEMLPYLFDPTFSQKAMGTGLGLHNVKEIIEAHGGWVLAKLNRRGGMSFYLYLPIEEA
jgi:signal transduction histidine kinase